MKHTPGAHTNRGWGKILLGVGGVVLGAAAGAVVRGMLERQAGKRALHGLLGGGEDIEIGDMYRADGRAFDMLLGGSAPYKVLETARAADGDIFLVGVGDEDADLFYVLVTGMEPVGDPEPDFEASLEAFWRASDLAHGGNKHDEHIRQAIEHCVNVTGHCFVVPDDEEERNMLRGWLSGQIAAHKQRMDTLVAYHPDAVLSQAEAGWLFASPMRIAKRRLNNLH